MSVNGAAQAGARPTMRERVASYDWSSTPLGSAEHWPQSLRTAVDMVLASGHAMCLAWGDERTFIYNDAYAPLLGDRHPEALGQHLADVWPEIWAEISPLVDRTFAGESLTFVDMPLVMTRRGVSEETWWSFSYSPVRREDGSVAGLLNVTLEATSHVLAERGRSVAGSLSGGRRWTWLRSFGVQ